MLVKGDVSKKSPKFDSAVTRCMFRCCMQVERMWDIESHIIHGQLRYLFIRETIDQIILILFSETSLKIIAFFHRENAFDNVDRRQPFLGFNSKILTDVVWAYGTYISLI